MKIPDSQISVSLQGSWGKGDLFTNNPKGKSKKENCWSQAKDTQLYPTLCNPMDYGLPGSSVHGIFQARILEQVVISYSLGFYMQGLNLGLLQYRGILHQLSHQGSPHYLLMPLLFRKVGKFTRLPGEISITSDMKMTTPLKCQKAKKN